jgi:large subunit ribosomal protein L22
MKASLTNYRQSPRKVRLVTNAVKGKSLAAADMALAYMPKRAAEPIQKLLKSAGANAKALGADVDTLVVKNIEVNKGLVMKRFMPRAMGVAKPIRHRTSHVEVTLGEAAPKNNKKTSSKKLAAKN